MKNIKIFEKGDKVKIEMTIERSYFENGEIFYVLSDPRRMNKTFDYPFTDEDLELIEEDKERKAENDEQGIPRT